MGSGGRERPTVLLVEHDEGQRERLGSWLEEAGCDVLACPGPEEPDYVCVAGRGLPCPLAAEADVVVLNLRLGSDDAMRGMPGWQLMLYYAENAAPLVVLAGPESPVTPRPDAQVAVLRPQPARAELLAAVRRALDPRAVLGTT